MYYLGTDASAANEKALIDEVLDCTTDGGATKSKTFSESDFVFQA
jgi:hypothetical protein